MTRESASRLIRRHQEGATGGVLERLHADGWAVLHDVRWPGRQPSRVDYVAIGPPGVFVIDAKSWSGRIEVRENSFWCRGRRQDRVVGQASEAALAVAGLLSGPASATVASALCFERDEPVVGWCYDVMLCSTGNLRELLVSRPTRLSADEIALAAIELDLASRAADARPQRRPSKPAMDQPAQFRPAPRPRRSTTRPRLFGRWLRRLTLGLLLAVLLFTQLPRLAELRDDAVDRVRQSLTPDTVVNRLGYDSCDALRAIYPHGVGTPAAVRRLEGKWGVPAIKPEIYRASAALDKDGDGLVCEGGR